MKIEELFSVRGKVALVTGGSRGLGEIIARAYVENGAKVYITSRNAEACMSLAEELSKVGECIAIPADLSRMEEIERLSAELHKREKKLDILVNNAGASWGATFAEFPEKGWDKVMDLNVKSVFFLTQQLLDLLEAAGSRDAYSRVINIGSIEGIRTTHLEAYSYAASKAAVVRFTETLALELKPFGIDVNAVAPGALATRMMDQLLEAKPSAAGEVFMARMQKLKDSGGTPLSVGAKCCVWLASEASNGITGKLVAAQWDPYEEFPQHAADLDGGDIYALRRITPKDRGKTWGKD